MILLATAVFCLFFDGVLKDTVDAYMTTSESLNTVKNKITSEGSPLTDEQIIKLFSNDKNESQSVQELINSFRELLEALAYLIITLALLQGYTIIKAYRNNNDKPNN